MAPGYSVVYVLAWCGSAVSPSHDLVPDPALTDKRLVFILNAPETPRQKERERERERERRTESREPLKNQHHFIVMGLVTGRSISRNPCVSVILKCDLVHNPDPIMLIHELLAA